MRPRWTALWLALVCLGLGSAPRQTAPTTAFGREIAALSERGGYFDTDNLISNETSYLQVVPDLSRRGVHGGAYIGVGPEQNFSYIAAVRPSIALIIDIRRDNLLLHLLFKALFARSPTRVAYLSQLFGRPVPADAAAWTSAGADKLAQRIDATPPEPNGALAALHAAIDENLRGFGAGLSATDLQTIRGFHQRFIDAGLGLRFETTGRPPHGYYPTYRDLLLDHDPAGRQSNFLGSEDAFQSVKTLEGEDRIIPVVGDLGGATALGAVGAFLRARHETVSAFYTSNVEFYLFREGTAGRFAENLRQLPHTPQSVIIRAVFDRFVAGGRPGDDSATSLQRIDDALSGWASGRVHSYADLVRGR